jgi:hypothetical protein
MAGAVFGMVHFRMELHCVNSASSWAMAAMSRSWVEAMVLNPSGVAITLSPCDIHTVEPLSSVFHKGESLEKFSFAGPYSRFLAVASLPPRCGKQLHAVADAQNGYAELKQVFVQCGGARIHHRGRPARKNNRFGVNGLYFCCGHGAGMYFRVNACFTHAPGNQLGELGAVIQNKNGVVAAHL